MGQVPLTYRIRRGQQVLDELTVNAAVVRIGRAQSCHIRLEDSSVSREHAVIEFVGPGRMQLTDLESDNGTFINGLRVERAPLLSGDVIGIGGCLIDVYLRVLDG